MPQVKHLIVLPALKAHVINYQKVILTQKFLDGILEYLKYWSGKITVVMEEMPSPSHNLDNIEVNLQEIPFSLKIKNYDHLRKDNTLKEATIVLSALTHRQNKISQICNELGIPCVYIAEYSLKTRHQIIRSEVKNKFLRWRRYWWALNQELKQRQAIAIASGVQCNGTPTYEAYRFINQNSLLYFDNRITTEMLVSPEELAKKLSSSNSDTPLRLLFSGRLNYMKGADHLISVAQELAKMKINFKLFICGDGSLRKDLEKAVRERNLSKLVKFLGVLNFQQELIPFAKKNIDLFVCCHRQGDPACTYLETMACGVPIVGYDNEAFVGIVKFSEVGWLSPIDQPHLLAKKIASINSNREQLSKASYQALDFAKEHTLEKTFAKRISHLIETKPLKR